MALPSHRERFTKILQKIELVLHPKRLYNGDKFGESDMRNKMSGKYCDGQEGEIL